MHNHYCRIHHAYNICMTLRHLYSSIAEINHRSHQNLQIHEMINIKDDIAIESKEKTWKWGSVYYWNIWKWGFLVITAIWKGFRNLDQMTQKSNLGNFYGKIKVSDIWSCVCSIRKLLTTHLCIEYFNGNTQSSIHCIFQKITEINHNSSITTQTVRNHPILYKRFK